MGRRNRERLNRIRQGLDVPLSARTKAAEPKPSPTKRSLILPGGRSFKDVPADIIVRVGR